MSNELTNSLLKEVSEFIKLLRSITIIVIVTTIIMLIPINITYGEPLSFYLLRNVLNSPITRIFPFLGFNNTNNSIVLIAGSPVGPIRVVLSSALLFGLLISSPISLYLFYRYLKPALYPHERKKAVKIVLYTAFLFYGGIVYGLTVIAPLTMYILIYFGSIINVLPYIAVADFYEFIVLSTLATAIGFLIPLAIYILGKVLHIDINLRRYWRYILVVSYAITAVLTPDPTPITALLIVGPPLALGIIAEVRIHKMSR